MDPMGNYVKKSISNGSHLRVDVLLKNVQLEFLVSFLFRDDSFGFFGILHGPYMFIKLRFSTPLTHLMSVFHCFKKHTDTNHDFSTLQAFSQKYVLRKSSSQTFQVNRIPTVDGRNPAPPGMVKTLFINNGIIIILGGAGFCPSTVCWRLQFLDGSNEFATHP